MRAKHRRTRLSKVVAVLLTLLLSSCAYGTRPPRVVKGQEFAIAEVGALEEGMQASEAREIIGDPLGVEQLADGERWEYYARVRKDGVTYILGFIPKKTPHFILDYELELVIREGRVEKIEYVETKIR